MPLLLVQGSSAALAWREGWWIVLRGGTEVRAIRARDATEIQCLGPVDVQPGARAAALARGVPLVFFTADGRYRGRLEGPRSPAGEIPIAQARWLGEPSRALLLALGVVAGKIANCRTLLLQAQRSRRSEAIGSAACALRSAADRLPQAPDLASLRGREGDAAARYFAAFGEMVVNDEFPWHGRTRRPPRDPLNACLSFGYTLLASRVEHAVRGVGLLPGAGALHEPGPGRAALVFDLVEEFRAPVVDRLVLRLVNRRQFGPGDFEDPAWRNPSFPARRPAGDRAPAEAEPGLDSDAPTTAPGPALPDPSPATRPDLADGERATSSREPLRAELDVAVERPGDGSGAEPAGARPSGAVHLGRIARAVFLREFAAAMRSDLSDADDGAMVRADWLLERQARRAARLFLGREDRYRPFLWGAR